MDEAREFDKLQARPVELEFKVSETMVKAWLHCLTDPQMIHCVGVYGEQYDISKRDGQDEEWCRRMGAMASNLQTIVYAVRLGIERNSKQMFTRAGEVMRVAVEEREKMMELYFKSFDFSEEDLGNLLGARIATSSTRSSLPTLSQAN